MHPVQRQYGAAARLDPENIGIVGRVGHRENPDTIGSQEHDGIYDGVMHGNERLAGHCQGRNGPACNVSDYH